MKLLIVEDDKFKCELITDEVRTNIENPIIFLAQSVQKAIKALDEDFYDYVLLDIALPSRPLRAGGTEPLSQLTGGVEVLHEISLDKRDEKVVIITQYPEIEYDRTLLKLNEAGEVFRQKLNVNVIDAILFNPDTNIWRKRLSTALNS